MAKRKKEIAEDIAEIKKLLENKQLTIGTSATLKKLKLGKVAKVFLSSNAPKNVVDDIAYYSKLGKVSVIELDYSNIELGTICKKPFPISVLSVSKK